jgi:hypothetical protein
MRSRDSVSWSCCYVRRRWRDHLTRSARSELHARQSFGRHDVGWKYEGQVDCSWPRCANVAGRDPVPHLVDVPDDSDEDDRPVYLCAEHRAAFDHAFSQASISAPGGGMRGLTPAMRSFLVGLSDDRYSTPSLGVRPPIRESIKGSAPRIPASPPSQIALRRRSRTVAMASRMARVA